jgi:hypothetical protein
MIIDSAWGERMALLVELMQLSPHKPMKKLQWEAMKYFPLYYTESQRSWMSSKTALKAAERLIKQEDLHELH